MKDRDDVMEDRQIKRQLEAVVAVTRAFIRHDFDTMLQKVLTAICDMVSAKYGAIYLLENQIVTLAVEIGASEDLIRTVKHQKLPESQTISSKRPTGLAAQTIVYKKTIILGHDAISSFMEEKKWSEYAGEVVRSLGITDILSTPIFSKNKEFGVIQLARIVNKPFSSQEIDLIESFAQELAIVFAEKETRRETTELRKDLDFFIDLISHDISSQAMITHSCLEELQRFFETNSLFESEPDLKFFMEASRQSILHVQHVIDQVKLLNRVRLLIPEEIKPFDLIQSIKRAIVAITSLYPREDIRIAFNKSEIDCWARGSELVDNCLINLFQNAVLADPKPVKNINIKISLDTENEENWKIEIADHGEGIPDSVKPKIFDRYFRSRTRSKGSGLGLYLVRRILETHGGSIRVEDRFYGDYTKGARFILKLPRSIPES
ncbi:MAG: ATP-binding protein [Candidatus Heimdallarchaeota archaeon]